MYVRQLSGPSLGALGAVPCPAGNTTFVMPSSTQASPCSAAFLGKFQGLQRAINAYVERHGVLDTIRVDGDIGPITLATAQQIWEHGTIRRFSGWPASAPTSANHLAQNVDLYSAAFSKAAGAAANTTPDPATAKPRPSPKPDPIQRSGMGGIFVLAAAAGALVYTLTGDKSRKKKKSRRG